MASTISAGTTTTTALIYSADSSGVLQLQTNNGTTALTLDTSQNVGVGVTPSAWDTNSRAIQLRNSGGLYDVIFGGTSTYTFLSNNSYRSASGVDRYLNTYAASNYFQNNGTHQWFTAASGTAGNAITFTQVMTLDASGNLLVGTTSPSGRISVVSTSGPGGYFASPSGTAQTNALQVQNTTNSAYITTSFSGTSSAVTSWTNGSVILEAVPYSSGNFILDAYSGALIFQNGRTESARINSSGNLVFAQNGGGVQFTNSSALANSTLNDYETGTFTPQVYAGGSPAYSSYFGQVGNYTKIGNTVSYQIYINPNTRTSATGAVTIVGLPFVTFGTSPTYHTAAMYFNGTYSGAPQNYIPFGNTYIAIGYTTAGAFIQFTSTNLNGGDMIFCGTYKATF